MARPKRNSKGLFYEVIELPPGLGGKRQRKYLYAKTVGKLKEKVAQFHADQAQGVAPVRSPSDHTVASWLRQWLEGRRVRGSIRPSTYKRYEMDIRNHLIPALGHIALRDLTNDQVQQLIDHLIPSHAPRTIRNIMTPLQEALDTARKSGKVKQNAARDVEFPPAKSPDLYQMAPDEIQRFLDVVRGERYEALYWLAVLGLREGELLGLRWANVDLECGEIKVTGAVQRVGQPGEKSRMQFVSVKTPRAIRVVRLPADWLHMLRIHRARQDEERQVQGWQEHDLVFPSIRGTPLEPQNLVNRYFKPALSRAGLPAERIRFHDLRHAAASMLIALGYDARTVADILGHSSPEFTLRQYAHSFEDVRQRAVADVGSLLREPPRVLEIPPKKTPRETGSDGA